MKARLVDERQTKLAVETVPPAISVPHKAGAVDDYAFPGRIDQTTHLSTTCVSVHTETIFAEEMKVLLINREIDRGPIGRGLSLTHDHAGIAICEGDVEK